MGNRKKYTEEYKKDAVRLMQARGTRTIAEVAKGLGVSQSMLHRWHKRYGSKIEKTCTPRNGSSPTWADGVIARW